jgi:hypothetical protein
MFLRVFFRRFRLVFCEAWRLPNASRGWFGSSCSLKKLLAQFARHAISICCLLKDVLFLCSVSIVLVKIVLLLDDLQLLILFVGTFTYECPPSESEASITTDGQPVSLPKNKAPIWSIRPDCYYYQTFAGLLMKGALSDKRTVLSFTVAAGPRQRSYSQVRTPRVPWPHVTVSNSRLPLSWRASSPHLYPAGIWWPGYTPRRSVGAHQTGVRGC